MWFGQPLTVKLTGVRKKKGDDGGCFAAALAAVRQWGGVLEHPWGSHAWPHFGLARPARSGGWIKADDQGGWTCCVEQGQYGHYARKPTMLYVSGVVPPELHWGHTEAKYDPVVVARMGLKRAKRPGEVGARGGGTNSTPRIHTPAPFRDLLIGIAASTNPNHYAAMTPSDFADSDYADLLDAELLVPHYLLHCRLYYDCMVPVIEDHQFDLLARRLDAEWDSADHPHRHLIDRSALRSGGSYLTGKYPLKVIGAARHILQELAKKL
jgi:hypothetical protein